MGLAKQVLLNFVPPNIFDIDLEFTVRLLLLELKDDIEGPCPTTLCLRPYSSLDPLYSYTLYRLSHRSRSVLT